MTTTAHTAIQTHAVSRGASAKSAAQMMKLLKGIADGIKNSRESKLEGAIAGYSSAMGNSADLLSLRATGLVFGEFSKTMSVGKVLTFTPGKAGLYISALVFDKAVKAAGLMDEKDFSDCQKAMASLAADLALGLISLPTGIAVPFAVASIGFSAYDMSNKCIVPRMQGR